MEQIYAEALRDPQLLKDAPHTLALKRVDEVLAARHPILRWQPKTCQIASRRGPRLRRPALRGATRSVDPSTGKLFCLHAGSRSQPDAKHHGLIRCVAQARGL